MVKVGNGSAWAEGGSLVQDYYFADCSVLFCHFITIKVKPKIMKIIMILKLACWLLPSSRSGVRLRAVGCCPVS